MSSYNALDNWNNVRKGLINLLETFTEEELSFTSFLGAWNVRETIFHIAASEDGWFRYCISKEASAWPDDLAIEDFQSIDDLKGLLKSVHDRTVAFMNRCRPEEFGRIIELPWGTKVPLGWIFWHLLEHEIHHRGELSIVAGMLGREGVDV